MYVSYTIAAVPMPMLFLANNMGPVVGFGIVAYGASFIGFITLVGTVYPVMGYLGFTLIGAIIFAWVMKKRSPDKVGISK